MASLKDYWNGYNYVDEDGNAISKAEALAEVKFQNRRYIGVDAPVVQHKADYASMARGQGWPWARDRIDYDPGIDEDQERED